MALRDHVTPRIDVPLLGGNSVALRGFGLDDFMALMPNHMDALSKIAMLYAEHKQSVFTSKAFGDFIIAVAAEFPSLVSEVISIAADEPDSKGTKLTTGLQIACLSAIVKLTLEDAGGLGNLFAQLRGMGASALAAQAEATVNSRKQPPFNSSTGHGASK